MTLFIILSLKKIYYYFLKQTLKGKLPLTLIASHFFILRK